MGRPNESNAKQRIMDAAFECFNFNGIRGVSADTIIQRADVAKMTLYKHFPTKDALAAAYVRARSDQWMRWLIDRVKQSGHKPSQRLLAIFDALEEWFTSGDYYGCPFHRAAGEFPDLKHPIHREAMRNKHELRRFVTQIVSEAGLPNRANLVGELLILIAGSEVMANIEGPANHAKVARRAAGRLIRRP
jgi:AcrR family transcriptional regulator